MTSLALTTEIISHNKFILSKPFKITFTLTQVSKLSQSERDSGTGRRSELIYSQTTWNRLIETTGLVRLDKQTSTSGYCFVCNTRVDESKNVTAGEKRVGTGIVFVSVFRVDRVSVCLEDYGN